jgi:hypothetical protein
MIKQQALSRISPILAAMVALTTTLPATGIPIIAVMQTEVSMNLKVHDPANATNGKTLQFIPRYPQFVTF